MINLEDVNVMKLEMELTRIVSDVKHGINYLDTALRNERSRREEDKKLVQEAHQDGAIGGFLLASTFWIIVGLVWWAI